jgi:hypothetical protein
MDEKQYKTLKKKVYYCLENDKQSRNSDIRLTVYLWATFHKEAWVVDERGNRGVNVTKLFDLPREDHIARARRQIQNDDRKFPPTSLKVAEARGWLEDEWKIALGYKIDKQE